MFNNLFIKKPVSPQPHVDAGEPVEGSLQGEANLKRVLTAKDLIFLGVGAIIGAGIFVITGEAAANYAGPAIMISFIIAGITCAFAGLCYAEFSSMIPVSGSAYSYAYSTLGELVAWFIGWCLVLEYLFAASAVAVGWSAYAIGFVTSLFAEFGIAFTFPETLASAPVAWNGSELVMTGHFMNLPAVLIVCFVGSLCYMGLKQSVTLNAIVVALKVVVILLFVAFASQYIDPDNWKPLIPEHEGGYKYGWPGVIRAASIIFFAYIGFDAVSTAAQETINPQKNVPRGILGSLIVCTILYIIVSAVMTGVRHYLELGTAEPVLTAIENIESLSWLKLVIGFGAVAGLTTVVLVLMMALPRILLTVGKDGLLPSAFGRVHPKFQTPSFATVVVAILALLIAAFLPLDLLGELVSMGTLFAFCTVCIGVLVLRYTQPDIERPFKVPFAHVTCTLGALCCLSLFYFMGLMNWLLLGAWTAIGMLIYFGYGYHHSKLRKR